MSEPSPAAGPAPQPPGTLTSSRYAIRSGEDESVFACSYHVPQSVPAYSSIATSSQE